jgi:hypothetical protein
MRVRILFRGTAVRGPAGVADAVSSVERLVPQHVFEIAQLALSSLNFEFVIFIDDRNTRRVIAAVFQLAQSIDNQRDDLFVSDVSNYSAHI